MSLWLSRSRNVLFVVKVADSGFYNQWFAVENSTGWVFLLHKAANISSFFLNWCFSVYSVSSCLDEAFILPMKSFKLGVLLPGQVSDGQTAHGPHAVVLTRSGSPAGGSERRCRRVAAGRGPSGVCRIWNKRRHVEADRRHAIRQETRHQDCAVTVLSTHSDEALGVFFKRTKLKFSESQLGFSN